MKLSKNGWKLLRDSSIGLAFGVCLFIVLSLWNTGTVHIEAAIPYGIIMAALWVCVLLLSIGISKAENRG